MGGGGNGKKGKKGKEKKGNQKPNFQIESQTFGLKSLIEERGKGGREEGRGTALIIPYPFFLGKSGQRKEKGRRKKGKGKDECGLVPVAAGLAVGDDPRGGGRGKGGGEKGGEGSLFYLVRPWLRPPASEKRGRVKKKKFTSLADAARGVRRGEKGGEEGEKKGLAPLLLSP